MIHVFATIQVTPGKRDDFLAEFRKIVPVVRAENGCLEYGPAIDMDTSIPQQEPPRADVVRVVEKWQDIVALKAHLAAPHMVKFREAVKDLLVGVSLVVLAPA